MAKFLVTTIRTVCGGVKMTKTPKRIEKLFKDLGGRVLCVTDKSVEVEFNSKEDQALFEREATRAGVVIDFK